MGVGTAATAVTDVAGRKVAGRVGSKRMRALVETPARQRIYLYHAARKSVSNV